MLVTTPVVPAALAGLVWGIIGGALPGISASITMALILPLTFTLDPVSAVVLLASTYIGAEYGGSIPAILIRTPGTNSAAATVIDGYEMKRQGRAGEALGISLWSGIVGSLFGLVMLILMTEPLSRIALAFKPTSYCALGVLGLSIIGSLSEGSMLKGLIAGVIGLMIATVGTDPLSGVGRFTFRLPELIEGIPFILVMVGIFALSELMVQSAEPDWSKAEKDKVRDTRLRLPSLATLWRLRRAQGIGWFFGLLEGLMPGGGGSVAAFMSYNEARRWSKEPEKFGHGSEEGVAAPESANNVVACTALIPTLSFGIPGSNSTAVLLGGLLIMGCSPVPSCSRNGPISYTGCSAGSSWPMSASS